MVFNLTTPVTILITDDHADIRRVVRRRVEHEGYTALEAENGEEAIALFEAHEPDIVLLDSSMPVMNGISACRLIRDMPTGQYTPILMITAHDDDDTIQQAFAAGATDYIVKPIRWIILQHRLKYLAHSTRVEKARRHYAEALKSRNRELDAYAHTIAHDLKNPLSIIASYTGMLKDGLGGELSNDAQDYVDRMERSVNKMTRMINQLLQLAQATSTNRTNMHPLDMNLIARSALLHFDADLQQRHIVASLDGTLPPARGFELWVEEVFSNLISNAIKYMSDSDRREIVIRGEVDDEFVRYEVADTGLGISEDQQQSLFEMFSRGDSHPSISGHGLGLAIVQRMVSNMGGEVGVNSEVGVGSTFWFTLPCATSEGV